MEKEREYELPFKMNLQLFAEGNEDEETEDEEEAEEEKPKTKRKPRKKKAEVDLEAEKAKWKAEYEAEQAQKKINTDTKTELEKIKALLEKDATPKVEEGIVEPKKKTKKGDADTIPVDIYNAEVSELKESIKMLLANAEKSAEKEAFRDFEKSLKATIKDKSYLQDITDQYLDNGSIKNMADFERIVLPHEAGLKETAELKKQLAKFNGKNPNLDYVQTGEKRGTKPKSSETEDRYKNVPAELSRMIDKNWRQPKN